MVWVKLDDQFPDHPKIAKAGPCAAWLHVCGIAYSNRHLTDGFIPLGVAHRLTDFAHYAMTNGMEGYDLTCEMMAARLVDVALWDEVDGGYQIHDYHDFQPSKAEVEALRKARSEAGKLGGKASAQARAEASVKQELDQSLEQSASNGSSKIEANFNPVPVPKPLPPKRLTQVPAFTSYEGHESQSQGGKTPRTQRLLDACGIYGPDRIDAEIKFFRALKNATESDVVAAIDAAKAPGTKDKLGMALSVLKKRRAAA